LNAFGDTMIVSKAGPGAGCGQSKVLICLHNLLDLPFSGSSLAF
jgi:hypothetical protein